MFATTKARLTALLCALALMAGACGSGSSAESVDSGPEADESSSSPEQSPTSAPVSTDSSGGDSESPLGDLLGLPITDDEAMEEYFNDLGRQAELKAAECMIAQGFEYKVADFSNVGGLANSVDFESREFAEQYGFGIASNPFEESFEAFEEFEDPNQAYLDSLTEGERDAYQTALAGSPPEAGDDFQSFEPGGCQGEAFEEVFSFFEVLTEFGDEFEAIEEAFDADPRIVAATSGWGACMTEAGYRFTNAADAESDIRRRYESIVNNPDAFVEGSNDSGAVSVAGGDGGEEEFLFGPGTLNPEFQQQVDDLAVEERAIAIAGYDCNGPLREIEDDVQREYEQRFVDENGAAISNALAN